MPKTEKPEPKPPWQSFAQLAKRWGVSQSTIRRMAHDGQLPGRIIELPRGTLRVEVDSWEQLDEIGRERDHRTVSA